MKIGNIDIVDLRLGASQVKAAYLGSEQIWGGEEPAANWLCFTAEQANSTVRLDKVGSSNAVSLETSTDGSTWTDYSWSSNTGDTVTLANIGDKVYMRAKNENSTIGGSASNYYYFVMAGEIAASGNIQTLLKADGSRTNAPKFCYYSMFSSCTSLTKAPELPATTLGPLCYQYMFSGCTSLTAAPAMLPATTLALACYDSMFDNCTSLTKAPELPATTLAENCYNYMFRGCSNLSSMNVGLSSWTAATTFWLQDVAASGTFICPAELSDIRDESHIPVGWDVVHPVEYIEADSQQYLDTGCNPQDGDEFEITWANTDNTKENKGFLVGSYWSGGGRVADGEVKPWIYPGITGAGFSTPSNFYVNDMVIGEKFTDHMGIGTSDGKSTYTMYRHSTDTLYSYNAFKKSSQNANLNLCGVSGDASSLANKRIYGWKHWRNGALIRDMVPIDYNGVGAMYDNVTQAVFTSGSGVDFLLPNAS